MTMTGAWWWTPPCIRQYTVLLDFTAYIDGRPNATTAWSKTSGGDRIIVTFWPAQPPRVSYFSVSCPDLKPGDFAEEPVIMASEDDIVLLCVVLGTRAAIAKRDSFDYFVYQAAGGCGMPSSSLKLLKHPGPSRIFHDCNVGLLRCRGSKLDDGLPTLRSHGSKGDGFYVIAALRYASMVPGRYDLYTYDSRTEEWATKVALLRQEQELGHHSSHKHTKVITVGGKAGTMGWDHTVPLCYVALPAPLNPDRKLQGGPRVARDIAVVNGCIKYVELQKHISARKKKPVQFELLPKLVDDQGTPQPTLERLHTAHPTLSLHEDNVVYFGWLALTLAPALRFPAIRAIVVRVQKASVERRVWSALGIQGRVRGQRRAASAVRVRGASGGRGKQVRWLDADDSDIDAVSDCASPPRPSASVVPRGPPQETRLAGASCVSYDDDYDRSLVADASLHPPIHGEGPDATPASVLLDFTAY
ncbi:hypothetical protein SETIT_4G282800v2 [Setaria italica]|uniref:DUF1618 domain-containing protein n=1 Tax=Setaria italica TaxID=4555 RepID=A0A368QZ58_SETIT|nr:hypothetical protein SETIT_4G282800v2 [Setaria italica]